MGEDEPTNAELCELIDEQQEAIADLQEKVADDHETLINTKHRLTKARERVEGCLSRIEELEAENEYLRDKVDQEDDTKELLKRARKNGATTTEERAVILVQTLGREAQANADQMATMTANEAVKALNGGMHQSNTYGLLEDTADLVGRSDVLYYQRNESGSNPHRLVLDLSQGELPAQIAGHELSIRGASA